MLCAAILLLVCAQQPAVAATGDAAAALAAAADQAREYRAIAPKNIIQLQQFRRTASLVITGPDGSPSHATLVQLNPAINAWLLLTLDWGRQGGLVSYHLENPEPRAQTVRLGDARGIVIARGNSSDVCDLWSGGANSPLEQARRSSLPYAPLCGGHLYLRNQTRGSFTWLEKATDFLRKHVWGGEKIIYLVRKELFQDAFLEKGKPGLDAHVSEASSPPAPLSAAVAPEYIKRTVIPESLGIDIGNTAAGIVPGHWYSAVGVDGVYLSLIQPQAIPADILNSYPGKADPLDPVESGALAYMVAFNLDQFDLGFALGTEHPALGWSKHSPASVRDPRLPGPDGIDDARPLARTGMVSPALAANTVATFTGGFKREHGAFLYGPLSQQNHGSHYGLVEQGTVFSKLQPGLATLYVLNGGMVGMKTWAPRDNIMLEHIRHARQNGVPLLEYDHAAARAAPGALVGDWGGGNWSGSSEQRLRTLRAGVCLQQSPAGRFLIYGYFSSATPSAMARVFQAYSCNYAMQLDMNALEHTYLALYRRNGENVEIEHLITGMAQVEKTTHGQLLPRFIGLPDNRDFFYLVRRGERP